LSPANAARRGKRFTELYSKAEAELGDDLSAVEAMLLESAINLFIKAERTHDVEQKVRATNAAARLFFALHKSHRKPAPPPPSLGELGL
jgi:hypothetical protein